MGNFDDAISITIAVPIVLAVGFMQEQRSEKLLEALNEPACTTATPYTHVNLANEIVPGDIITLTAGDRVPANIQLPAAVDLQIDGS
ncbi:hypothetical protein FIBSPDRAFT_676058, partial [Athelia psychrophila]